MSWACCRVPAKSSLTTNVAVCSSPTRTTIAWSFLTSPGRVQHVIGTGEEGRTDAACEEAQFRYPRGIAADPDFIYVADTGNRVIRRVDRRAHQVTTIAGHGKAGQGDGPADAASFEAPASLALAGGLLYIADAQTHTIRVLDLTSRVVSTLRLSAPPTQR